MINSIMILNVLILMRCRYFGANLLINSNFSQPSLNQVSQLTPPNFQNFASIPGWQCTTGCELDSCPLLASVYAQENVTFGDCDNQVLDINAETYGTIYQIFQSQAGSHLLQVQFLLALFKSNQKIFLIYFNGVQIYRFKPLTSNSFFRYNFSSQITAIQGTNNLSFTMETIINDTSGYRLCYVSFRKVIYNSYEEKLGIISSPILSNFIKIPAIRIILGQIVNFFVPFDRLQLYYFHNRDYSYNVREFLKQISILLAQKGAFSQEIIQILFDNVQKYFQIVIDRFNYKSKYIGKSQRNQPESGLGFLQNNFNLIFYSLPFFSLLIVLFYGLFRLSFHQRISTVFRKYCFKGIIILMIFEGNIQQFSFYLFGQIFYLFSTQFSHKLVNVFIIIFLFFLLLSSTFIYLWFKCIYKNLSFYFIQGTALSYSGIITYSLDKGLFCFILGAVHQIGVSSPNKQLLMLATVELCWVFSQINGLSRKLYKNSMFVCLSVIQGLLRIVFLVSLYGFELSKGDQNTANFINSSVHFIQQVLHKYSFSKLECLKIQNTFNLVLLLFIFQSEIFVQLTEQYVIYISFQLFESKSKNQPFKWLTIIQLFFAVWITSFFISLTSFCLKSSFIICPRKAEAKLTSTYIHENFPVVPTSIKKNKVASNYCSSGVQRGNKKINSNARKIYYLIHRKEK